MKTVCILDFETTALNPKEANPIELAAVLCEVGPNYKIIGTYNKFIWQKEWAPITKEIENLTGITNDKVRSKGVSVIRAFAEFLNFTKYCDYFLAHNCKYDRQVFFNTVDKSLGMGSFSDHPINQIGNWLCSIRDVEYPERSRCRTLGHLAFDHGVFPAENEQAHSAMVDIVLLRRMLVTGGYTVDKMLEYRDTPFVYLKAVVPPPWEDGGKGKDAAKAAGFTWERCRGTDEPVFSKSWVKRVKENKLEAEKNLTLNFQRQVVQVT